MPRKELSPDRNGQRALLASIGKEIARHEAALVDLRQTEKKLIRLYERGKREDEFESLRALVVNYECGGVGL